MGATGPGYNGPPISIGAEALAASFRQSTWQEQAEAAAWRPPRKSLRLRLRHLIPCRTCDSGKRLSRGLGCVDCSRHGGAL